MLIPIGQVSTATIQGRACKGCRCESCHAEFVYLVEREGVGKGSSVLFLDNQGARDRAAVSAEKNLEIVLQNAVEIVPCPKCGWLQADMVAEKKKSRFTLAMWISLPLSMILLIVSLYFWGSKSQYTLVVFMSAIVCLLGGIVGGFVWRIKHDPNAGHPGAGLICQERAQASRAILRSEFESQMRRVDS